MKAISALQSHSASNPNSISQYAGLVALSGGDDIIAAMVEEFNVCLLDTSQSILREVARRS